MTESPTTAIAPRGPGVSRTTVTNSNSADAGLGTTISPTMTAMITEMARVRMSAQ